MGEAAVCSSLSGFVLLSENLHHLQCCLFHLHLHMYSYLVLHWTGVGRSLLLMTVERLEVLSAEDNSGIILLIWQVLAVHLVVLVEVASALLVVDL